MPDFSSPRNAAPLAHDFEAPNLVDRAPAPRAERVIADPKPADKHGWWWGLGRRKTAVARVRIRAAKEGEGRGVFQFQITRKQFKTLEEYFPRVRDRMDALSALELTDTLGKIDVIVRCTGGGITGQAQAVRLGIARALIGYDPNLEPALREAAFLTRDSREVERKKYGQPGARRRFQFSKR